MQLSLLFRCPKHAFVRVARVNIVIFDTCIMLLFNTSRLQEGDLILNLFLKNACQGHAQDERR
jgi:hypothetical protein